MRDHVEREVLIRGPIERAFAALTDPALFPTWGPERVEGTIAPGERPVLDFGASGRVRVYIVAVEPPRYFAYRWVQGVTDPEVLLADPLAGHNTLVEFHLEAIDGGTRVRVRESGLASLPGVPGLDRDKAIEHMGEGWRLMLDGLRRSFVDGPADRVETEVTVATPAARAFAALASPTGWWAQTIDGAMTPGERPTLDFGPFGRAELEVVAVEPPARLAFRWSHWGAPTLVELTVDDAAGGAVVRQVETGFTDPTQVKRARLGWGVILGLLEGHLRAP